MQDLSYLKNIPQELKLSALWCAWKFVYDKDRDVKIKKPFNVLTGYGAKSNDPSTFVSYKTLLNNIHKYYSVDENGKQQGGVGLGIFNGYSAVDIDHCVDEEGNISEMARDIIDFCQSYTEFSPSGTGIRIIFKTQVKIDKSIYYINNHNNGLEIYISNNTNKFVTITGNRVSDEFSDIADVDITYLLNKYMRKSDFSIEKYLKKDDKLKELWYAEAPGSHADESERDIALCCKLAFYLRNNEDDIKRYFEMSPYYKSKDDAHKAKWNSVYSENTIRNAIGFSGMNVIQQGSNNLQIRRDYDLSDTGNAHKFIDKFGSILKYNFDNKMWMIWNGKYWQYDLEEQVKNFVEVIVEEMQQEIFKIKDTQIQIKMLRNIDHINSSAGKEALLKEARHLSGIPAYNSDFDKDEYLICCDNGTIDLRTGEVKESVKSDMISMTTGCEISYEEPVRFKKFLSEMFEGKEDLINYVHKALGYSMTNSAREQCMFILHSDGNSGKSLLLDIIKSALGSYGVSSKPQLLTEQRFGTQNSEEIARLKGKRFIAVEEIGKNERLDERLVKSLTSGIGNQVARFLYGNSFEFPVKGKIWLATNYEPVISGTDRGIWRRIKKIPINADFTGREDKDLREKLIKELPEILGWLLEGYRLYMKEGLIEPSEVSEATVEYRKEMDLVQQWIDENCELRPDYFEKAGVLFENFKAFMTRRDQRTNMTAFGKDLSKKYNKKHYNTGYVYFGIRLRQEAEDLAKKVEFDRLKVDDSI